MFFHSIPGTALMFLRAAFHAFFGLRWYHLWHYNFDMLYRFSCFYFLLDFFHVISARNIYVCAKMKISGNGWIFFGSLLCDVYSIFYGHWLCFLQNVFFLIFILPSVITFWLRDKKLQGFKLYKWFIFMFCYLTNVKAQAVFI